MRTLHPINAARTLFGYNAIEDKGRRKAPEKASKHEAKILTSKKRKKLTATTQDQYRNHALVAWMVRKHLDYVSKFHISFRTGNQEIDDLVNRIFRWHGRPVNIDHGARFGRDELFRLFELEKVICGDAALAKVSSMRLQAIESDLIAKGTLTREMQRDAESKAQWESVNDQGLKMTDDGARVEAYSICNRGDGKSVVFDHLEPAENVIFDAYWTRFSSQFRGVSPLATALNTIQDIHEGMEYNQVKAKMHALFGVALLRNGDASTMGGGSGVSQETSGTASTDSQTELDINPTDVNLLDLNPGEDLKVIESGTPSTEFVNGQYLFIQIALLALDIPVTAFDSRRSSFSARIADLNEYEVSVDSKRTKNRYVRQAYSDWVLANLWGSAQWRLGDVADRYGMTLRDVQEGVEWIPSGSPWLDKLKQVKGDELAIDLHLDNAIDASRRRGADVFKNIDKQIEVEKYERERRAAEGLPVVAAEPVAQPEPEGVPA